MRHARKLALLAILAITGSAVAAPSASAQSEPLAHNQTPQLIAGQEVHGAPDLACPLVTPSPPPMPGPTTTGGGCRFHVTGTDIVFYGPIAGGGMETVLHICGMEFDMRMDSAGEGYLSHMEITPNSQGGLCTFKACRPNDPPTSENRAWSVFLREVEGPPNEAITFLMCIKEPPFTGLQQLHCEFTLPFYTLSPHRYSFSASSTVGHNAAGWPCKISGSFFTEASLGVTGEGQAEQSPEIRHN